MPDVMLIAWKADDVIRYVMDSRKENGADHREMRES
jgi:hypothetical protein